MDIVELMYQRMWQLSGRIIEIKNYVKRDGLTISKKDYSLRDIPKLELQVEEMSVGIKAIEKFRRDHKLPISEQEPERSVNKNINSCKNTDKEG